MSFSPCQHTKTEVSLRGTGCHRTCWGLEGELGQARVRREQGSRESTEARWGAHRLGQGKSRIPGRWAGGVGGEHGAGENARIQGTVNKHGLYDPTWWEPCLFTAEPCLRPGVCSQEHTSPHIFMADLSYCAVTPRPQGLAHKIRILNSRVWVGSRCHRVLGPRLPVTSSSLMACLLLHSERSFGIRTWTLR